MNPKAILMILQALPENAPELIREANPATWIERILHEGHQYKLAKLEIERQAANDKGRLDLELQDLAVRKEVYLESLNHQIKLIETGNAPIMAAISAAVNKLNEHGRKTELLLNTITSRIGELDADFYQLLFNSYLALEAAQQQIFDQINKNLDKHYQEHRNHVDSVKDQIMQCQKGIERK